MTKKQSRIRGTPNRDNRLLDEVNHLCPLCGKYLSFDKKGKLITLYDKSHIYPHNATVSQLLVLQDIQPPANIESLDNLIALCKDCHTKYDSFTTKEEYLYLFSLKQNLSAQRQVKEQLSQETIENDIKMILNALENLDVSEIANLKMDPVSVKQKIRTGALQAKILGFVTQYFGYLKQEFQNMNTLKSNIFEMIATEIKLSFQKASREDLLQDQEQIFDSIVYWLKSKTNSKPTPCEIVIAYFIQNCEVFDVIPE